MRYLTSRLKKLKRKPFVCLRNKNAVVNNLRMPLISQELNRFIESAKKKMLMPKNNESSLTSGSSETRSSISLNSKRKKRLVFVAKK
jgi:hypothetical protein